MNGVDGRGDDRLAEIAPDGGLSPIERALLLYLQEACGRAVPREELLSAVWGYAPTAKTRTVETTVKRIRRKIEDDPSSPEILRTVHGLGYQLVVSGAARASTAPTVTRAALERRLQEWLAEGQGWVTVLNASPGRRTNLVLASDSYVGRDADAAAIDALFAQGARLVTIHGTAGLGKTRLAREVAARQVERLPGGVWFCDLSSARTPSDVMSVVATELGLVRAPGDDRSIPAILAELVRAHGPTRLVLDNLEQLDDGARVEVAQLLGAIDALSFLVTSRARLGIAGEHLFSLAPLSSTDAVRLLRERIDAVRADRVDPLEEAVLSEIAALLEGMPLAIEMAAARARIMPLRELRSRLRASLSVLALDRPDAPHRQQTLERAIDWSWSLLSTDERSALAQLATFRGGCRLEVAEEVIRVDGGALSMIASLMDKSMIRAWDAHGSRRFGLFQAIREHALARAEPSLHGARERHAAWALRVARVGLREFDTVPEASHRLLAELGNLVAAHDGLVARRDPRAMEVLDVLGMLHALYRLPDDQVARARATRDAVGPSGDQATRLHQILARAHLAEKTSAATLAEIEAGLRKAAPGDPTRVELLFYAALVHWERHQLDASLSLSQAATDALTETSPALQVARVYNHLGVTLHALERLDEASAAYRRACVAARSCGAEAWAALYESNLAGALSKMGAREEALELLGLADARAAPWDRPKLRAALGAQRGLLLARMGRWMEADTVFRALLENLGSERVYTQRGSTVVNAGIVALMVGATDRARALLDAAADQLASLDDTSPGVVTPRAWRLVAAAVDGDLAAAEGLAVALADTLPRIGDDPTRARIHLALACLDAARARAVPNDPEAVARHRAAARAVLDDTRDDDPNLATLLEQLLGA